MGLLKSGVKIFVTFYNHFMYHYPNSNIKILKSTIMKKLAYITLIAAFVFGVQTQKGFSSDNNTFALEEIENENVRIGYDEANQNLNLVLVSDYASERVAVQVFSGRTMVIKEMLVITDRSQTFNIDLSDLPNGAYTVMVTGRSFKLNQRIKKK